MKQYKALSVVALVTSLLLVTASSAAAHDRQGTCTGDPSTCQMQNQGMQGCQGMQNGQGMQGRQGMQNQQGMQGCQGTHNHQGMQGRQGMRNWQGMQGQQGMQNQQGMGNQNGRGMQDNQGMGAGRGNANGSQGMGMGPNGGDFAAHLPAKVDLKPSDAVVDAMKQGLLDEYNANAVYAAVIDQLGDVRPFTNIQRAEQQHIAAWQFLFDRYGVTAPKAPTSVDVPEFVTQADACKAAAELEQANMVLYDGLLSTFEDYPDMTQVVTSLRNASADKHLPTLERCAGVTQ